MTVAFSIILSGYCFLLLALMIGWRRMRATQVTGLGKVKAGISVVVACRNEDKNIATLVQSLSSLQYPPDRFEVILVNDHSTDQTREVMKQAAQNLSNGVIIHLPEGMEGKKQALLHGIRRAKFDIIATTDADCRVPQDWLSYVSLFFENGNTKMLAGAVGFGRGSDFFSRLQAMEFSSLVGTAAAAIGLGHPVMSNGANLAFRKEAFSEVGGYEDNLHIPSGDDEFLMRKIFKRFPEGIVFMNFPESVVLSQPQQSLKSFIFQRIRWAGKWKHNADVLTRTLAVFIVLSQISFIALAVRAINNADGIAAILIIKILLELIFLAGVLRFLGLRFDGLAFFLLQIIYPVYVMFTAAFSIGGSYPWKQRNYK